MRLPTIRGVIDRRILVNFRVDPDVLARALPAPFRPQLYEGFGQAGICLIRLAHVRPRGLPAWVGIGSENAAHRIAVEWDADGQTRCGVFVPRRDTSSWLNSAAGGRIFPGVHHRARFDVHEDGTRVSVAMQSVDGRVRVAVDGAIAESLPAGSIFNDTCAASQFYEAGSVGYSPSKANGHFDGLELRTHSWSVQPLAADRIESSYFDDRSLFPAGSVTFDHALLMRGIEHTWHSRDALTCAC